MHWILIFFFAPLLQAAIPTDIVTYKAPSKSKLNCLSGLQDLSVRLASVANIPPPSSEIKALATPQKVIFTLMQSEPKMGWENFALQEYGEELGPQVYERLKKINPNFIPLLASPGIVNYLSEFELFSKGIKKIDSVSHEEIYQSFKEHLGTETYYRGLRLTPEEYKRVTEHGMLPRFYNIAAYVQDMPDTIRKGIRRGIENHQEGKAFYTMSITQEPAVALSEADQSRYAKADSAVFLFKFEMPKLEVFEYGSRIPYSKPSMQALIQDRSSLALLIKGAEIRIPLSPRVESFVVGGIEAAQIKEVWMAPADLALPTYGDRGAWTQRPPTHPNELEEAQRELLNSLSPITR